MAIRIGTTCRGCSGSEANTGELLGAAVVLSDVTKFHLVDQLKSDMISTVSHELKTPLTSLQMVVHLLLEEAVGPLTTKQTELLLAARQDSDRLLGMINDLLDLTRIEQGRVALDQEAVDPSALIRDAVERHRVAAEDAGITLECQVEPALPPVLVDRERIEHVFDNLMSNALRHTDRGGTITLRALPAEGAVEFSIEDTGEGIAPQFLSRIFDKFYRAPGAKHQGGPAWAWPSSARSSWPMVDRSRRPARRGRGRPSRSAFRRRPNRGTGRRDASKPSRLLIIRDSDGRGKRILDC